MGAVGTHLVDVADEHFFSSPLNLVQAIRFPFGDQVGLKRAPGPRLRCVRKRIRLRHLRGEAQFAGTVATFCVLPFGAPWPNATRRY